jgi:hypothetical protein
MGLCGFLSPHLLYITIDFLSKKYWNVFIQKKQEEGEGGLPIFHFSAYARRAKNKKRKAPCFSARGLFSFDD